MTIKNRKCIMCEYLLSELVYPNGSFTLQRSCVGKLCSGSDDAAFAQIFSSSPFGNSF